MATPSDERLSAVVQEALGAQLLTICRQQVEIETLKAKLALAPKVEPKEGGGA